MITPVPVHCFSITFKLWSFQIQLMKLIESLFHIISYIKITSSETGERSSEFCFRNLQGAIKRNNKFVCVFMQIFKSTVGMVQSMNIQIRKFTDIG